jgi:hypothetical protein
MVPVKELDLSIDLPVVHKGAISAVEILNENLVVVDNESAMPFADDIGRRTEVALRIPPDHKWETSDGNNLPLQFTDTQYGQA